MRELENNMHEIVPEDNEEEEKKSQGHLSLHHEFLVGHGWRFLGSNHYEMLGKAESADRAYEIEKYRQELGIGKKISKGGVTLVPVIETTKEPSLKENINKKGGNMAVKTKPWSEEEINILIEGYKTKSAKEMSEELGRIEGSIRNKIYELTKAGKIGKKVMVKKTEKVVKKAVTKATKVTTKKAEKKPVDKKVNTSADALAKKLVAIAKEILKTLE